MAVLIGTIPLTDFDVQIIIHVSPVASLRNVSVQIDFFVPMPIHHFECYIYLCNK